MKNPKLLGYVSSVHIEDVRLNSTGPRLLRVQKEPEQGFQPIWTGESELVLNPAAKYLRWAALGVVGAVLLIALAIGLMLLTESLSIVLTGHQVFSLGPFRAVLSALLLWGCLGVARLVLRLLP